MYSRNLIEYLPEFLRDVREFDAILRVSEQPEMVLLWDAKDAAMDDQFIMDATENGVSRWEKILGIVPKATDTLDIRKFSILAKLNGQLPFTITTLKEKLKTLCGEKGYKVELYANDYTLFVGIAAYAKTNFEDVRLLLKRIVPANLITILELLYNQHLTFRPYTHGSMRPYTHTQLRNEAM